MSDLIEINPIAQAQHDVAEMLRASPWMQAHNVSVVEQNSLGLKFLMTKSIEQLKGVVIVVGCDEFTNDYPALDLNITISATENILQNRVRDNSATALDVIQAAIDIVDGEWWHFGTCRHECPEDGILQATADFRGKALREQDAQEE